MQQLWVEELESRNLPSTGGLGHQSLQWLESTQRPSPSTVQSAQTFTDFDRSVRVSNNYDLNRSNFSGRVSDSEFGSAPAWNSVLPDLTSPPGSTCGGNGPVSGIGSVTNRTAAVPAQSSPPRTDAGSELASNHVERALSAFVVVPEGVSGSAVLAVPSPSQSLARAQGSIGQSLESIASAQADAVNLPSILDNSSDVAIVSASENIAPSNTAVVEALASALSLKPNPTIQTRADAVAGFKGLQSPPAGRVTELAPLRAGSDFPEGLEGPLTRPQPQQGPQLPVAALPQAPPARSIRASLASLPQLADLMNEFSVANLTRIEQSISAFLKDLEDPQSQPIADGARDLYPWILAGVVTALACELARRQLRATASLQPLDLLIVPANPWIVPHEHEHGRTAR